MTVTLILLCYDITFDDADNGRCFAGDGKRILKAFANPDSAKAFVQEWQPVVAEAGKEMTVFPVQRFNKMLKKGLGFTLDDWGQNETNYRLETETAEVEDA